MATEFQRNAFQNNAFQIDELNTRDFILYMRRYLNDLLTADASSHSVSFTVAVRDASIVTYMRRYLNDV